MAIGIKHNGASKVLDVNTNADGLEYGAMANTLVFHDGNSTASELESLKQLVQSVPIKYLKRAGNVVSEMNQSEKNDVDAAELAAEIASVRALAKQTLAGFIGTPLYERASWDIVKDEINILRQWIVSFKAEVAASISLADFKVRVATLPNLPDRSLSQLKTAIESRIDSGTVDN